MGNEFSYDQLPDGEWDSDIRKYPEFEYNFIEGESGYTITIKRMKSSWTYCGYVQLPKDHPDFNKNTEDLELNIHGGITYASDGLFGFDCHHLNDLSPVDCVMMTDVQTLNNIISREKNSERTSERTSERKKHYWTFEEVKAETEKLARLFYDRR